MSGIARMHSVVLDCPDPKALAEFYSALVGWKVTRVDDDWATVGDGGQFHLCFQLAPDHKPPIWPDPEHPQQAHIDVVVDDMAKAEAEVLALGAVKHAHQPAEKGSFTVFLDPAGHPFCLCDAN
ncbi:VOC family protein [Planotetraspora sp. A-T 1434]|uniref:VOC family protein n=1 Tax=Planotetraspora sp. A-T 1434 TaxID=2979219 RepID=UPI0021BFD4CD|nr:VOC family protein [Planotetraspora sp. A-T 1434]MCT9931133.1 VOC family protein [Planotetraspora sp. A-T 1434]